MSKKEVSHKVSFYV